MKKYISLLIFIATPFLLISQNVKFEGIVKNKAGEPLEMANVIAFKKGTKFLQSYSITDSKGNYKLSLEENESYTLKVSYLGFNTKDLDVDISNNSEGLTKDIVLEEANEELSEVEITYEMPVKIVGDTIVYNTDSFTSGKEKKLEDVLKKLPGIDIDDNGEVEVEGKKVQKVLVEGKEFFDGDSKLATQNIPASAIDKVEVLKNYNEVSGMRGVTNNEDNIALNIRLKTGKDKFWFGEVNAGIGDNEKHILKPKLFYYSKNKSVNILADFNNIGETPFTMRDYFRFTGGLRGGMQGSGTSFNVSSGGLGFMTVQNNKAQEIISKFGALNFSLVPKKGLDFNGFAIVNDSETDMFTQSNTVYNKTSLTENSETSAVQGSKLGMLKFSTTYKPNNNVHIDYDIFGKLSEQTEFMDVTSTNRGAIDTHKEEKPVSLNLNFNVYYTINDKNIFASEIQHLYQKDQPLYNSLASTQPFVLIPSSNEANGYNLIQNQKSSTNKLDAKFDYYYLLTPKSNINFSLGSTFSGQTFTSKISQELDNGSTIDFSESFLNNDVDYNFSDLFLGVHYKMVSGIFTFNPGVTVHNYTTKDVQLGTTNKDNLTKVLPDVYANLQLKSSESLRFNYAITTQFSDINTVSEGYILDTYRSLNRGSRTIENSFRHRYSLNYYSFSMFSFTNINASINYTKNLNTVKNNSELIGVDRISFPVNSDFADETLSAFFRYGKTYSKLKTNFRANVSNSIFNNIINDAQIKSKTLSHSYQASVATKFKDAPNFEIGYQKSFTEYSNTGSTTDRPFANIEIGFLKNFILTADYSHYNYSNDEKTVKNKYSFLNANLYYQQKESDWEFKISANNLTDNKSMNSDNYNEIIDSNSNSLYFIQPRIVMFSVKYNL
ncbi:carboxypeptidase-like regulatory domain-containing protein [Lutibacter flavus]|uniref:Outer membrane protein beta-barrel family protein n=1 Tax=Lutibacter flavus TaxID=691689 RepID=A0A238YWZ6_9FLAO|nr:carboxypeptidase-like regulatory domain-containing protein [Lutibacter flavus]SNR75103.1 Outer membrane protein beta-barrel family protein [Lutibacter flavus]